MTGIGPGVDRWWVDLRERLGEAAVAVGASAPQMARRYWCAGRLGGQPVTPSTTFYAASVTKQLVAALVARAVLDGDIDTQDRVVAVLSGLPPWTTPIRIEHLLHHTGGLPQPRRLAVALGYTGDAAGWSRLTNEAVQTALHHISLPPVRPGQNFSYDNTGYILLAEVVQAARGRSIDDLAQTAIFDPLRLTGTRLGGPAPVTLPGQVAPPATIGDGGMWTCAADLMNWLEAMNKERLGTELTALVQTPGELSDGTQLDYAWGISLRPEAAGTTYLHSGEWPGWCALTTRRPATATAAVILAATNDMPTVTSAAHTLHAQLTPQRQSR